MLSLQAFYRSFSRWILSFHQQRFRLLQFGIEHLVSSDLDFNIRALAWPNWQGFCGRKFWTHRPVIDEIPIHTFWNGNELNNVSHCSQLCTSNDASKVSHWVSYDCSWFHRPAVIWKMIDEVWQSWWYPKKIRFCGLGELSNFYLQQLKIFNLREIVFRCYNNECILIFQLGMEVNENWWLSFIRSMEMERFF